jgi:hypothetical protein
VLGGDKDPTSTKVSRKFSFTLIKEWMKTALGFSSDLLTHEKGGLEADVSAYDGLVKISGGSTSAAVADTDYQSALTFGIANTNAVKIDSASVADDEYARFTASGLESRSASEVKNDLSLNNVENLKVKLDATEAPDADNDTDEGYSVGSRWFDITNDKEYVCLDNTDGAAVWTETTASGGASLTATQQAGINISLASL